jgi:RNA polymerase sigma-70 factor (ECF subfamily)
MPTSQSDHDQLLRQAGAGDLDAFARLFDRHRALLRLVVRAQMGPVLRRKADSSDLIQETFLTAAHSLGEFRGQDMASFVRWLEVIATRRVCDAYRRYVGAEKRAATREVSLDQLMARADRSTDRLAMVLAEPSQATPSQAARHGELVVQLANALSELPEDYQRVVEMRFLEERPLEEIAREMGRSKGAVTMLLARAVQRLRTLMRAEE